MYIKRVIFLSFLLFSNLSYSDDNNQQLLIKDPKKVEIFSMKDINDSEKKISSSENKILLLNFWATWCAPCIKEIPELIELKKKFKNNVEIYFLSVDSNVKKTVPKFLRKNKLESLIVFNDEKLKVSSKFGVKVMPTTVIINKNFEEVAQVKGYVDWSSSKYIDLIKKFL
jgi:thiol-disulfide isomerase/thioredoxin|tara:strand:- start:145 stop:654 length:510 start_codon:yes stop_codon:yes gene_type:complete